MMTRPWIKIAIATAFGITIASSCIAEAVATRIILPW
jgi:hypothetical protein